MEKFEAKKRYSVYTMVITGLRFCGIWHIDESSTHIYSKSLNFFSSIIGTLMVLILTGTIAADLVLHSNDLLIVTDDGCYLAGLSVILFKIYKFHYHHQVIRKLTAAVHKPIDILRRSSDEEVLLVINNSTFYENIGFSFFVSISGILWIALIFIVPRNPGELPLRASHPFDTTTYPMHQLVFIIQMYAVAYGLITILLMDALAVGFLRWINVQLIILTFDYENCNYSERNNSNSFLNSSKSVKNHTESWTLMSILRDPVRISKFTSCVKSKDANFENTFTLRLKRCVINHQRLIDVVNDVNNVFGTSMLMQVFASITMICLTGFQAVLGAKEKSNLIKFVVYLSAALSQLFYWCWYGNELIYQKHSLIMAQWMSGWEDQLNPTSKILIIMSMMRALQPLELKAGAFFILSMDSFITVI
ncbi:hypothetical protein PV328_001510 [Microctonus aethiopoides]|uniref:Odorant receptor n=1 Tax=Microctonus aethiopoides TaxID=144406 RepID=A0AA39KXJ7_9HYME|nr:hypothetical protein PV328_001510 [Microctonus aethiopoides]